MSFNVDISSFITQKEDFPEFFLINNYMDDFGNIHNTTTVAVNHRVSCYTGSRNPEVPMVYPWAKSSEDPMTEWIWTDAPFAAIDRDDRVSDDAKARLVLMGYQPIVHADPNAENFMIHCYAKINQHSSLMYGCGYIEYIPNGETYLKMGQHPSIMTVSGVYAMMADHSNEPISDTFVRDEYIIGLEHLHGRINDTANPISEYAVLILTEHDTTAATRSQVVQDAIDMGFDCHELSVLIDMMASGRVVFDNDRRSYTIDGSSAVRHGFFKYAGQKLLSANEFYEMLGYEVKPRVPLPHIGEIYRACSMARNNYFNVKKDPMDGVTNRQLVRIR